MHAYWRFALCGASMLLLALALGLTGSAPTTAAHPALSPAAAPQLSITDYPLPHDPQHPYKHPSAITTGPDGNVWFTEPWGNKIGRITPAGTITEFSLPGANSGPNGITIGPDGNLWFAEGSNKIGRITPTGVIHEFPIPTANSAPEGIAWGVDGNLWFTEASGNNIGRITPAGQVTEYPLPTAQADPFWITANSGGAIWFTEQIADQIGRITPSGQITEYPAGGFPTSIANGPDGNIWVGLIMNGSAQIARLTPRGVFTRYSMPDGFGEADAITIGPDGNLWFLTNGLGRITTGGDILVISVAIQSTCEGITAGITTDNQGHLWFTDPCGERIRRVSDLGNLPTATPVPPSPTPTETPTPYPTATPICPGSPFTDVCSGAWYYPWVLDLTNLGAVSGYRCGGPGEPCDPQDRNYFRPYADITRGQLTKAAIVAFAIPLTDTEQIFADVPPDNAFYSYVNTAYLNNIVSGYDCGAPGEPCDPQNRPYFRPYAGITRGQASKIITLARDWPILTPPVASFADVDAQQPFYSYVETIRAANTISGYDCGGPGEPCDAQHRPYFRPGNNITRAQAAKILDLARSQAPPTPTPTLTATPTPTGAPPEPSTTPADTATPTESPSLATPTPTPALR